MAAPPNEYTPPRDSAGEFDILVNNLLGASEEDESEASTMPDEYSSEGHDEFLDLLYGLLRDEDGDLSRDAIEERLRDETKSKEEHRGLCCMLARHRDLSQMGVLHASYEG